MSFFEASFDDGVLGEVEEWEADRVRHLSQRKATNEPCNV